MPERKLTGYPSIDKPWLKHYTEKWSKDSIPSKTVYRNIYDHKPIGTAIVCQSLDFGATYRLQSCPDCNASGVQPKGYLVSCRGTHRFGGNGKEISLEYAA